MQWNNCHTVLLTQINSLTIQSLFFVVTKKSVYFVILIFYILLSSIAYLPHRKEVLQPFYEITFPTWQNLIAYGFAAASLSWGNHSNSHAEEGKQWRNISAGHFQSVCTDANRKGSIGWFGFSLCLLSQLLPKKEISCLKYCVCGRPRGREKKKNKLIRTDTNLFTSMPLTCLFLMKAWCIWERERERRKMICKTKMFCHLQSFFLEPNTRKHTKYGHVTRCTMGGHPALRWGRR